MWYMCLYGMCIHIYIYIYMYRAAISHKPRAICAPCTNHTYQAPLFTVWLFAIHCNDILPTYIYMFIVYAMTPYMNQMLMNTLRDLNCHQSHCTSFVFPKANPCIHSRVITMHHIWYYCKTRYINELYVHIIYLLVNSQNFEKSRSHVSIENLSTNGHFQ